MKTMSEIHRMALAAATGVVGRQRHRVGAAAIGLLLGGAGPIGCVVVKVPGDLGSASEATGEGSEGSEGSEATGSSGLMSSGALSDATGMDTSSGDATGASTGEGTSSEGTSSGDASSGTSSGDTDSSSGSGSGTDGELDECVNEVGEVDWACCEAQDWQPPEHCTPWGPPAPPRMVRAPARGRLV